MKYFKDPENQNEVYAYAADGSEDGFIRPGLVPITEAEADRIRAAAAPMPVAPMVVSRFQARAALHLAGLLDRVEQIMADPQTPVLSRLAWQDAQEFRRSSPTLLALADQLGLSAEALDQLFITASEIQA